jgi:hypothetical protein
MLCCEEREGSLRWEEKRGRGFVDLKRKEDTTHRDKEQKEVMMAAAGCACGFCFFACFLLTTTFHVFLVLTP